MSLVTMFPIGMRTRSFIAALLICGASFAAGSAHGATVQEAGRKIIDQYQEAVVTVQIDISQKMALGGQDSPDQDIKVEAAGTIISPDGLTVVPLMALDPSFMMRRMMGPEMAMMMGMDSQVKDIKLLVGKRKEIPATASCATTTLIWPSSGRGKNNPSPSRPLISPGRAIPSRSICARTGEIQAVIEKPRKYYVPNAGLATTGFGVPLFGVDGDMVGILSMHTSMGGGQEAMSGLIGMNLSNIG
jgi:hypothetical protein